MSIYLFTGSNWSLLLVHSAFYPVAMFCGVLWQNDTSKVSAEENRKCPSRNIIQSSTPTLSATMHSVTDGQTDRRQHHANSRSDCSAWAIGLHWLYSIRIYGSLLDLHKFIYQKLAEDITYRAYIWQLNAKKMMKRKEPLGYNGAFTAAMSIFAYKLNIQNVINYLSVRHVLYKIFGNTSRLYVCAWVRQQSKYDCTAT